MIWRKLMIVGFTILFTVACTAGELSTPTVTGQATESPTSEPQHLVLATTTSVEDSGLLDHILPDFEQKFNADISVVAVGTGQALAIGEAGDADVLIVHAPDRELDFIADGHGVARYEIAYNDFIIVGSADDPANIRDASSAREAFTQIAEEGALFVSRGDDSGTHIREQEIWAMTGITPDGDWYLSAGQGMGTTLTMAEEIGAYTLTDRGTYLARKQEGLALEILFEGDEVLFNLYSILLVDPDKDTHIQGELALQFAQWLASVETQQLIADFSIDGQSLFIPYSVPWRQAQDSE